MHNRNKGQMVTTVLFGVYLAVLTWIIVFKFSFRIDSLPTLRGINLIPFAGSVVVNDKIYVEEIFQNMVAFIPVGVYIGMLKPEWAFWKKAAVPAGVSLLFETAQYMFAIGATDITDLLSNSLGGVVGILVSMIFQKIFREKANRILNAAALIGTVCMGILLLALIYANW